MSALTLRGRLERADLEGGSWQLHAAGERWTLLGDVPAALAGRDVVVEGERVEGMGIFMAGPQLQVRRIRAA